MPFYFSLFCWSSWLEVCAVMCIWLYTYILFFWGRLPFLNIFWSSFFWRKFKKVVFHFHNIEVVFHLKKWGCIPFSKIKVVFYFQIFEVIFHCQKTEVFFQFPKIEVVFHFKKLRSSSIFKNIEVVFHNSSSWVK